MVAKSELEARLARLQEQLAHAHVDVIAIAPTPNMRYLLGFAPIYDERLCALLVTPSDSRFVVPDLNANQVESYTGRATIRWTDEAGPRLAVQQALEELKLLPGATLAADDTMRASHLIVLQELAQPAHSVPGDQLMSPLRMRKSSAELDILAQAAAQADRALLAGVEVCRPGVTERAVAEAIASYFQRDGAEAVDFTIIAAGPHGAFPHHISGETELKEGDTIIIDIGATYQGYRSDVTRVVHLGEPSKEVRRVYDIVNAANAAGREAAVAGALAAEVDRTTRAVIEQAGYGEYFFHRTGHGLGMEEHEPPWISAVSETVLEPGMVFSVEPGIYLPGRFGVRVEDIVAVTDGPSRCLTGLSHELIVKK